MHSSTMRTVRCNGLLSCHACPLPPCIPYAMHTHPNHRCSLPCMLPPQMPPAMHNPCHTCPPPPCMSPCHACPLSCKPPCHAHPCHACPPAMHTPQPQIPPAMHAATTDALLPCTPPATHAPLPCMSPLPCMPTCHACLNPPASSPGQKDRILETRLWKHYLSATTVADGNDTLCIQASQVNNRNSPRCT